MTPADFRAAREALGLSQRELAEALGAHEQTVSKYERGKLDIPRRVELAMKGLER